MAELAFKQVLLSQELPGSHSTFPRLFLQGDMPRYKPRAVFSVFRQAFLCPLNSLGTEAGDSTKWTHNSFSNFVCVLPQEGGNPDLGCLSSLTQAVCGSIIPLRTCLYTSCILYPCPSSELGALFCSQHQLNRTLPMCHNFHFSPTTDFSNLSNDSNSLHIIQQNRA